MFRRLQEPRLCSRSELQVFTNKHLFQSSRLRYAQLTFAAFHALLTYCTLYILSHKRNRFALFTSKRLSLRDVLPLALAFILNVILPNLSLAYSSITFYQIARVLVTPCTAGLEWKIQKRTLPLRTAAALLVVCLGVGLVAVFDSSGSNRTKTTSGKEVIASTPTLGVVFALLGVLASSLYTVWISSFKEKLDVSSMQLLMNQAPVGTILLLYIIPFVDDVTIWTRDGGVENSYFGLILLVSLLLLLVHGCGADMTDEDTL